MKINRFLICIFHCRAAGRLYHRIRPPTEPLKPLRAKCSQLWRHRRWHDEGHRRFQKALDACAVNGGGDVLVPAGKYLVGSVQIGCRTILRLEKTASSSAAPTPRIIRDRHSLGKAAGNRAAARVIYSASGRSHRHHRPGRIEGTPLSRLRKTRAELSCSNRSTAMTSAGKASPSRKAAIGPPTPPIAPGRNPET